MTVVWKVTGKITRTVPRCMIMVWQLSAVVFIREEQFLERPVCLGFVFVSFVIVVLSCFLMLTLVFVPVFVYCYVLCTVSHKKYPDVFSCKSNVCHWILTIFGKNVYQKVGNSKMTDWCFCNTLQNWKHRNNNLFTSLVSNTTQYLSEKCYFHVSSFGVVQKR